jgi:hypothetical protein
MAELLRPIQPMWDWIDRTGGYPGKMMVAGLVVMLVVGGISWYSNRH